MKKLLFLVLISIFASSMIFVGVGCKQEAVEEVTEETDEAVEEVTEETDEAVEQVEEEIEETESIKLVVWWWGEQDEPGMEKWMKENAELYNAQNPNITIETVLQSTDNLLPSFEIAAQSQSGPDIQFFWAAIDTMLPVFNGNVAPISDYWSEEELQMHAFAKEVTYQEKIWTASFYNTIAPFAYNKDIFQKAGLDPNVAPTSWTDLLDASAKIKEAGFIPLAFGNKSETVNHIQWLMGPLGGQNSDTIYDYMQPYAGTANYEDNKYSEWWYKLEELVKKGYINDDANSIELWTAVEKYFMTGEAAMTVSAGGTLRKSNELLNNNVVLMATPAYGTGELAGKANVWRKNWGITSWSEHKQEAADFIKFMNSTERANAFYKACGAFPGTLNFDASVIDNSFDEALYEILQESFDGATVSYTPRYVFLEGDWVASQMIFSGEGTAEEAVSVEAKVIDEWKEYEPEEVIQFQDWAEGMK